MVLRIRQRSEEVSVSALSIRKAAREDVDDVTRIIREAFSPYVPRIGRPPAPMLADLGAFVIQETVDLAVHESGIAGVIILLPQPDSLYIDTIAVADAWRGRGVGRMLMAHAEKTALTGGFGAITLVTNAAMTENLSFYPCCGYSVTQRAMQDVYDRVFFRKELREGTTAS
jgi:ribosomal protein S18 acetylase RimI-like enzyme